MFPGRKGGSFQRTGGAPNPGVWQFCLGPQDVVFHEELESVHKRSARFLTGSYNYETVCVSDILGIHQENLRKLNRLTLLYKSLKGKASLLSDIPILFTQSG